MNEVAMSQELALVDRSLKTPRAAAIAGILFSVLSIASELMIRSSIPANPLGSAAEVVNHAKTLTSALNLMPFVGIAFLWFIAVFRDRLGELEDRFFATVVLGSGLLYIAMFFASAALAGGVLTVLSSGTESLIQSGAYAVSRAQVYQVTNIYGIKMAAVFMISTSTVSLRTRIFPRWVTYLGYALALLLLLAVGTIEWTPLVFPLWVLLMSVCILVEKYRG
jgi:preprotein translocase subunit Sec61beta